MGFFDWFKTETRESILFGDEVVVYYETLPPNFRKAREDPVPIFVCGNCKHRRHDSKGNMICPKYGLEFHGAGCGIVSICDDFKNGLFD